MSLTSTNFVAGKMNKSIDERLVPPGEYIDALNVRLGSTENTEIGAVENSRGNTLLTQLEYNNQPLVGDARCIGVYEDGINETLYWFVHNEGNPNSVITGVVDLVVSYNTNTGSLVYHCISTEVLNFDFKYLITGVDKIDGLLFWTDDLNPPRMINVTTDYDYPVGGLDTIFEEEDVSVIVKPPGFEDFDTTASQWAPLGSPEVENYRLVGQENYMETRFLSFAYRYRYDDGQYSATSLFTTPAFQPKQFRFSIQDYLNAGMYNRFNACRVTFSTGSKRVKEIDLLYKQTTSNTIYVIKRFRKADLGWADNTYQTEAFSNSEIYTTLGSDELLRLYDNVPRIAKAQTIQGNRLMYGNYVDGYNIKVAQGGADIDVDYWCAPTSKEIAGEAIGDGGTTNPQVANSAYTIGGGTAGQDSLLTWDLTNANPAAGDIVAGTTFNFSFSLEQNALQCNPGGTADCVAASTFVQSSPFTVTCTFTCPVDYPDVTTMCASPEFAARFGGSTSQGYTGTGVMQQVYPCNNTDSGGTLSDRFYAAAIDPMTGTTMELISGGFTAGDQCTTPIVGWPLLCSTTVIASGVTDGAAANTLTDSTADFVTDGVANGDLVMDMASGLLAIVDTTLGVITATTLPIADSTGGLAALETAGVTYQVVSGGGAVSAPCDPLGFQFTPLAGGFSLRPPAIQYWADDGAGTTSESFIYFNFIAYGCSAGYLTSADQGSLHSNRDYETGIVYMDEYGRSSTVLVSNTNTTYFDPSTSVFKNRVTVNLSSLPPWWAKKYKFVMKPSEGTYQTIFSNIFYQQDGSGDVAKQNDPSLVWFKLEGNNQNLVQVGDELIVKVDTAGPVLTEEKCTVLAVTAYASNGITSKSLKGLYMLLKPSGWTIESTQQNYFRGTKSRDADNTGSYTDGCINNYNLNDDAGVPYTIPAGSTIRIKIRNWRGGGGGSCDSKSLTYDKSFVSTADYPNFHSWTVGDDLQSQMTCTQASTCSEMGISYDPALTSSGGCTNNPFSTVCRCRVTGTGAMYFVNTCGIPRCWEWFEYYNGHCSTLIEVTRGGSLLVWETVPLDADPNLFYDASDLLDIEPIAPGGQAYHMAKPNFTQTNLPGDPYSLPAGEQNQAPGLDLITTLDFYNCYTFGNGVESFRVNDSPAGKSFNLGERTLAVSNQDFKEADRFAGMTYSGVFSGPANSNNLNEFNLGLANYKDCETRFGPIMKMHARETDILVLQEDRITYVLSSKNVITDSTGGGAIASVPEVLGTQIARIEEYGISFNPESFAAWGYDMFFTDTKRGAVINLRGASQGSDQLQTIQSYGMNSWFRDNFNANLTTQKLGGYDPYMKEFVLGTNLRQVPVPVPKVPCGQQVTQMSATSTLEYEVDLGLVIGLVNVPYNISSGTINISVTWNGTTISSGPVGGNGFFTFNKTSNTPDYAEVSIAVVSGPAAFDITVECPPEEQLTVIQVVVNSPNYSGEFITTSYNWTDGTTISPYAGFSPAELVTLQPSEYQAQTGVRSIGIFPYSGADITLRTQKIPPDNFDFDPSIHKFRILSSNTLYTNSVADTNTLLAAAPVVGGPITNPSVDTYQATETALSMPSANQYLYLIWDLRLIGSSELCYCVPPPIASADDVCCTCAVGCQQVYVGPQTFSAATACATDTNSPGFQQIGFNGPGSIPALGNIVYDNTSCNVGSSGNYLPTGFYVVDPASPSAASPKNWIEVGVNGVVTNAGSC
jgi:hypothetical protein